MITLLTLFGCGAPADTEVVQNKTLEENRWNLLVYMAGDNNLEDLLFHDLNELEAGGTDTRIHAYALVDRAPGYDTGWGDWTGTRLYRIRPDDDPQTIVSPSDDRGELDMGDPATLAEFLALTAAETPADHTIVSFWDHGSGWYFNDPPPPRSDVAADDTSGTDLVVAEGGVRDGVGDFVAANGPIDILAFDECYMGSWEVAQSLVGQADYMVASESWVDIHGLHYDALLQALRETPNVEPSELAARMAEDATSEDLELTFAAAELSKVAAVSAGIDQLATFGLSSTESTAKLTAFRDASRAADEDWPLTYLDLRDLAKHASESSDPDAHAAGEAILAAMDEALIANFTTGLYEGLGGWTIFADTTNPAWLDYYANAPFTPWASATHWDEVLGAIYGASPAVSTAIGPLKPGG